MKTLQSIMDQFVPSKETIRGNPDTMRISHYDVYEWENALSDYIPDSQIALIE